MARIEKTTLTPVHRARFRPVGRRVTALVTAAALLSANVAAEAQGRGPPTIRDAEIEQLLKDYTTPLLRVAGLGKQNIQVVVINDASFNAFVMDGRRIFVNVGALLESKTPNQIIGVLAHETGHIAGGHLAKMREQFARAQTQMILATVLGALRDLPERTRTIFLLFRLENMKQREIADMLMQSTLSNPADTRSMIVCLSSAK